MKTSQIARGIVGALSLAGVMGAVGCGAVGPDGEYAETEIGSTAEALNGTAPVVQASNTEADMLATTGRQFAASCKINDNGTEKWIIAGGFAGATALNTILAYEPVGNTWTNLSAGGGAITLANARGHLKGINVPGDNTKCLFIGGTTALGVAGVAALADVDIVDANGAGAFLRNAATPLNAGRAKFSLEPCGSKVIVVGGVSNTTVRNSIETSSNAVAGAAWATAADTLDIGRFDFGFVKDPNSASDRYVVVAGHQASGLERTIEVITTSSSCTTPVAKIAKDNTTPANNFQLTNAVEGNVAFPHGSSTDHYIAAAGITAAFALPTATDDVQITDYATPKATIAAAGRSLVKGTYLPTLVGPIASAGAPAFMLIGGEDDPDVTVASDLGVTNAVQLYQSGFNVLADDLNAGDPLTRSVGVLLGGSVYVAAGVSLAGGTSTVSLETVKITP